MIFPKARVQIFDLFQIYLLNEILNSVMNLSILQISNVSKFIILSHSNPQPHKKVIDSLGQILPTCF